MNSLYSFSKIRSAKTISSLIDEVERFLIYQVNDNEEVEIELFTDFPKKKLMIVDIIKYLIDDGKFSKRKINITFNEAYTKIRKDV